MQATSSKVSVLFLCPDNSVRSQIGAGFLHHYAGDDYDVYSAGLEPKALHPYTVQVMTEKGIDISGYHSKNITEYLGRVHFNYLITVCRHAEANCLPTFLGVSERIHWPINNAATTQVSDEDILANFREVRDQIDAKVQEWLVW